MDDLNPRDVDRPLHDDVRRLASTLGRVVRRLEGDAAFQAVEDLRSACRARRRGQGGDLTSLLARVEALPLAELAVVTRAFTLFFLLINTAEQVHRVRRRAAWREADASPQPGSAAWAVHRLKDGGMGPDDARGALGRLAVRPVLTAHPTEATRRTILDLQARVADLLSRRGRAPHVERSSLDEALEAEVELLWLTSEVREDRPTVLDEVGSVVWYLEDRLIDAAQTVGDALSRAFSDAYGEPLGSDLKPLAFGSWVGGGPRGPPHQGPPRPAPPARPGAHRTARPPRPAAARADRRAGGRSRARAVRVGEQRLARRRRAGAPQAVLHRGAPRRDLSPDRRRGPG